METTLEHALVTCAASLLDPRLDTLDSEYRLGMVELICRATGRIADERVEVSNAIDREVKRQNPERKAP